MSAIEGVEIKRLKVIADERGYLQECLRCDDPMFDKFGQVYISGIYQGVVKGWHCHEMQTDFVVCVSGMVKMVLWDGKDDSATHGDIMVLHLGDLNPILVKIPPLVYHGWKGVSEGLSLVMNCPDQPYNYKSPDEKRIPPHSYSVIPYDWARVDG